MLIMLVIAVAGGCEGQAKGVTHGPMEPLHAYYRGVIRRPKPAGMARLLASEPLNGLSWQRPEWGRYRKRASVADADGVILDVWAYDVVSGAAVDQTVLLVGRTLQDTPKPIKDNIRGFNSKVSIIGARQEALDIPEYRFLALPENGGAAYWNARVRGLGAVPSTPVTTFGEENVLELDSDRYSSESVMMHEFGHHVMDLGLSDCALTAELGRYRWARESGAYNTSIYMMENEYEYWAMAVQAWFGAEVREDTNGGRITRERLVEEDWPLAEMMLYAYGNGSWRYTQSCINCRTKWYPKDGKVRQVSLSAVLGRRDPQPYKAGTRTGGQSLKKGQPARSRGYDGASVWHGLAAWGRRVLPRHAQRHPARNLQRALLQADSSQSSTSSASSTAKYTSSLVNVTNFVNSSSSTAGSIAGKHVNGTQALVMVVPLPLPPWFKPIDSICPVSGGSNPPQPPNCQDLDTDCRYWASAGECTTSPDYMQDNCFLSCNPCQCGWGSIVGTVCAGGAA